MRILFLFITLGVCSCVDSTTPAQPAATSQEASIATPPPPEGPVLWPALPKGVAWALNSKESKIGFVGRKVTSQHEGGFTGLSGAAIVTDGVIQAASIDIDMSTTWSDHPRLTKHLLSDDFFDTEKHPQARFAAAEIEVGSAGTVTTHTIQGVLDMRGVLGRIRVPATISVADGAAHVKGNFHLNRQGWGIAYPGKPDNLIQDDVEIHIDLKFDQPTG